MSAHAHHGSHGKQSLNRTAAAATLHCLTGCAIGEVLGMVIGTALGFSDAATIALAIVLAFAFGYSLTMVPLLRAGLALGVAVPLAFASDTFSIAVMEIVDNGVMLAVPGAMDSPLSNPLFWGALAFALAVAYVFAFPVNRYLIARGRGHAVVHEYHHGGHGGHDHGGHDHHGAHASPASPDSPAKLIAIGVAAIAVTIGVAAGGAFALESRHDDADESGGHVEAASTPGHGEETAGHGAATSDEMGAGALGGLARANDEYALALSRTTFTAGRPDELGFTIVGNDGRPVRDVEEHGGVRMHLIVVRRDLVGYQHLHPKLHGDGTWRTTLRLPQAGVYRAFADFERGGEKVVLGADLFVPGSFRPLALPAPAHGADVDGYRVELEGHAQAGRETTLSYAVTRGGQPVDVEPYLGAAGHLVALRDGDLAYLHVHPLEEARGPIRFAATFPTAGEYRLFLQFKADGRVHTVPLTVDVTA